MNSTAEIQRILGNAGEQIFDLFPDYDGLTVKVAAYVEIGGASFGEPITVTFSCEPVPRDIVATLRAIAEDKP